MARERMVTRTVMIVEVEVMTVNTLTAEVKNLIVEIPGGITEEKSILKAVKKSHETSHLKCVAVVRSSIKEQLYGMPESEFIRLAKILPPRSKKDEE